MRWTLLVRDFKCLRGSRSIPIRPMTILLGENSTGKSTVLALVRLASRVAQGSVALDFNDPPFLLGAYDQIATYHGGRGKRVKSFEIGMRFDFDPTDKVPPPLTDPGPPPKSITTIATFEEVASQPTAKRWIAEVDGARLTMRFESGRLQGATFSNNQVEWEVPKHRVESVGIGWIHTNLYYAIEALGLLWPGIPEDSQVPKEASSAIQRLGRGLGWAVAQLFPTRLHVSAPIRSTPSRTYDPTQFKEDPQGRHAPMLLARLATDDPTAWKVLEERIVAFGQASGLLGGLAVKRKGEKGSDPFQVNIGFENLYFNLVDVGYGVSQVLPILVDVILGERESAFLLQQPEVHLHPRAQAELGSLLGHLCREEGKWFLVETHSDYLVNRIRMDLRDKKGVGPEDLLVLYFEKRGSESAVTEMHLGPDGDYEQVPDGYRRFFLEEQRKLLGG